MSKYAQREATERALTHHGVTYHREEGRWVIDGTVMTDAQAYAYALGFKASRDRWEKPVSEPTHTTSDRGFVHLEPVKGTSNGVVRVYESSAVHAFWPEKGTDGKVTQGEANGPFIWLRVRQQDDLDKPEIEAAAHLTIEAARTVRDQLSWLIDQSGA